MIDTRIAEGCTLECGPDSFLSAKPEAVALIKELGFGDEVIGSNDHQRTTYILKHGRLVPLPAGVMMIVPSRVMPMVKTSLVGWGTKLRMGLEYFRKPGNFEKAGEIAASPNLSRITLAKKLWIISRSHCSQACTAAIPQS